MRVFRLLCPPILIVVSFVAIAVSLQEPLVSTDELLMQSSRVHAPPPVEWKEPLGRAACSVKQTTDGGYVLVGSDGGGDWIVKTDAHGDQLWRRTYGIAGFETSGRAVQQTFDGGYIMAGGIRSDSANYGDARLVKINKDGNAEWERTYGGAGHEYAFSAQQTNDGGYVLAGVADPFGINNDDFYLVKTDPLGNVEWNKTYGGARNDIAWSIQQTLDGGYIMAGETYSFGAGWTDCWLVKTDADGNLEWNKTYGSERFDAAHCVRQTSDGGYILAGFSNWDGGQREYGGNFYLVKTDSKGDEEWHTNFGTSEGIDWAYSVEQTSDGGYIAAGDTTSFGLGSRDGWLIKTDSHLNLEWNKTLADSPARAVIQTDDRGFAVAGKSLIKVMRANPPIVCFTYSPNYPVVSAEIIFNASASYDLDEDIAFYLWDFDDGNVSSISDSIISHTFESPQIYNVTLTIIDNEGLNSSLSTMVWVRITTYISILSDATSIFVGFPTDFTGNLHDMYGNTLKNETAALYSSAGGSTWTLLSENTTDNLGDFSITWTPQTTGNFAVKIEWAGNQTFFQTNNVTNMRVLQIPTDISIALSSSTSIIGFKIEIRGNLTSDVGALQNTPILLSYSVTFGQTWNDITLTYTASDGSYSAVWMPSATGNYLVKATWAGNSTYPRSSTTISLAVTSSEGKDVFTVESNSTVSDMSFDSTSRRLTFRVSGETGTRGYVKVTIAKRLLANAEELKVRLNGQDSGYTLVSKDDSWVVYLNYAHSTHDIILVLGETTVPFLETQLGKAVPYLIASIVGAFLAAIYLARKRRHNESSVPTPKVKPKPPNH